jgi:UDP-glucose 4-epimerase
MIVVDRALVIGANGYLGRHLSRELALRGVRVVQSGRANEPAQAIGTYVAAELSDQTAIANLVRDVDEVYFAAGTTGTASGFERYQEFVQTNEIGLLNVLDALRRQTSQARLVFPSTRLVYRGQAGALAEDAELELKTPYALNKFAGEQLLRMYGDYFGVRWVAFRICVAYGEEVEGRRPAHGTVSAYIEQAHRGEDLVIFGAGDQRRTMTHIADVAAMMVAGAEDDQTNAKVLNLGGPDVLSVREIALAIAHAHGVTVVDAPWPKLAAQIESGDTVLDSTKLEAIIGREYRYRFHDWLMTQSQPGR